MAGYHLEVICPCCEAKLQVDAKTGEVVWKEEKQKPQADITNMLKEHKAKQQENISIFKKQSDLQKERNRLLEEKFKESQKHADKSPDKPLRDFDLD